MEEIDITELVLEVHERSFQLAMEKSIQTGVPLVVEKNGKIVEIKPKYKYIKVPIKTKNPRKKSLNRKTLRKLVGPDSV